MKFLSLALSALFATTALASPVSSLSPRTYDEYGCECLTDGQATYLVESFKDILTNPNRTAIVAVADAIIATNYTETSDSINSLAGYPLGGPSFVGKGAYIGGITHAPAIGEMTDILIFHDCTHITWYWVATGIGANLEEVKGINIFTTTSDRSQIITDFLEFNSIAWGIDDEQVTNTPPPAQGK